VPAPLIVRGSVSVDSWVTGRPLAEVPPRFHPFELAGDLLGSLHRVRQSTRATEGIPDRVGAMLDGAVRPAEATALVERVRSGLPSRASWGLTHGDLGQDNVVMTPQRTIVAIDNENVRPGFLDHDLARTWYRWPMSGESWRRLERAYARHRTPASDPAEVHAWCIAAVAKSVWVRRRTPIASAEPLDVLQRLLDEPPRS
jgi:Ser/Thr protein kinase RdoA (MazF antagonist)